jgi:hypothetical protein
VGDKIIVQNLADEGTSDAGEAIRLDPRDAFACVWAARLGWTGTSRGMRLPIMTRALKLDPAMAEARQDREQERSALAAR